MAEKAKSHQTRGKAAVDMASVVQKRRTALEEEKARNKAELQERLRSLGLIQATSALRSKAAPAKRKAAPRPAAPAQPSRRSSRISARPKARPSQDHDEASDVLTSPPLCNFPQGAIPLRSLEASLEFVGDGTEVDEPEDGHEWGFSFKDKRDGRPVLDAWADTEDGIATQVSALSPTAIRVALYSGDLYGIRVGAVHSRPECSFLTCSALLFACGDSQGLISLVSCRVNENKEFDTSVGVFRHHRGKVGALHFTEEALLSGGADGVLRRLDLGAQLSTPIFGEAGRAIRQIAPADREILALRTDGRILCVDTRFRKNGHARSVLDSVSSMCVRPGLEEQLLTTENPSPDRAVALWDRRFLHHDKPKPIWRHEMEHKQIYARFSSDGSQFLALGRTSEGNRKAEELRLYATEDGSMDGTHRTPASHRDFVADWHPTAPRLLLLADKDKRLRLLHAQGDQEFPTRALIQGSEESPISNIPKNLFHASRAAIVSFTESALAYVWA